MPQSIYYANSSWSRRWGVIIDTDIISGVQCSTCGTTFADHTYAQAKEIDPEIYVCEC